VRQQPRPLLRSSAPRCCDYDDQPPSTQPLEILLAAAPMASCFATGEPWFAAFHAPLLAICVASDVPPAYALVASTVLFTSTAVLGDVDPALASTLAVNLAVLGLLLLLAEGEIEDEILAERDAAFSVWDRRLRAAIRRGALRLQGKDRDRK